MSQGLEPLIRWERLAWRGRMGQLQIIAIGSVPETGLWEMRNRGTSGIVGGSDIVFRRHRRVVKRSERATGILTIYKMILLIGLLSALNPFAPDLLNAQLQKTAGELHQATTENAALQEQLTQKSSVIVELSLRADALLKKNGGNLASSQPIDLSGADPNLIKHINDLQEQLVVERKKNWKLKGT